MGTEGEAEGTEGGGSWARLQDLVVMFSIGSDAVQLASLAVHLLLPSVLCLCSYLSGGS